MREPREGVVCGCLGMQIKLSSGLINFSWSFISMYQFSRLKSNRNTHLTPSYKSTRYCPMHTPTLLYHTTLQRLIFATDTSRATFYSTSFAPRQVRNFFLASLQICRSDCQPSSTISSDTTRPLVPPHTNHRRNRTASTGSGNTTPPSSDSV